MVCIACFIAPVILFIWYKFVYPILQPLIDRFIGNYQLPQPFANLSCPLPKKSASCGSEAKIEKQQEEAALKDDEAASTVEEKKVN